MPAMMIPNFRSTWAIDNHVEKNILFRTSGGIGDIVCAEPAIRFGFKNFKDCKFTLYSEQPEFFRHLPFDHIIPREDLDKVNLDEYFTIDTLYHHGHLQHEFMIHMNVQAVDYASLCVFRGTLPVADKNINIEPSLADFAKIGNIPLENTITIHPGKHWQSKTFPKPWWDAVLAGIIKNGKTPILIGGKGPDNSGTVDVETSGCIDLRNELTLMQSVALLQSSKVFLTNDSAPLHMAASGDAWIGFIATCKHPDHITHWRHGQFGWRMQNLGLGGAWDGIDLCPNKKDPIHVDNVGDILLKWLPEPETVSDWAIQRSIEWTS